MAWQSRRRRNTLFYDVLDESILFADLQRRAGPNQTKGNHWSCASAIHGATTNITPLRFGTLPIWPDGSILQVWYRLSWKSLCQSDHLEIGTSRFRMLFGIVSFLPISLATSISGKQPSNNTWMLPFPGDLIGIGFFQESRYHTCNIDPSGQIGSVTKAERSNYSLLLHESRMHMTSDFPLVWLAQRRRWRSAKRIVFIQNIINSVFAFSGIVRPSSGNDTFFNDPSLLATVKRQYFELMVFTPTIWLSIFIEQELDKTDTQFQVIAYCFFHEAANHPAVGKDG